MSYQTGKVTIPNGGYSITSANVASASTGYHASHSNGYITITGAGGGGGVGGGAGAGGIWSVNPASLSNPTHIDGDLTIQRSNGRQMRVAEAIETMMEMMGIIEPDWPMMERYPALRDAYEHHMSVMAEARMDPRIRESYDSYQMIRKLIGSEGEDV